MSPKPLVWLITGCSAGFGLSWCLFALKAGHSVIATSRNPSKNSDLVKQVESLGGIWLPLDIAASSADLKAVIEKRKEKFRRIDVLVNMAGMGILGHLEGFNDEEKRSLVDTNFFGPFTPAHNNTDVGTWVKAFNAKSGERKMPFRGTNDVE